MHKFRYEGLLTPTSFPKDSSKRNHATQNMKPASTKPRVCLVLTPRGPNTRPGVALRASYELGAGAYPEFITHSEEFGQFR